MKVRVTHLMIAGMLLLTAIPAIAQPTQVTVRDINAIPQANIDMLNSLGTDVTENDINANGNALAFNDLFGTQVQFTAVLLTNPLNSGLSTATATSNPSRIHVFVRDTSAVGMGVEGMTAQLVDGSWETTGITDLKIGDVVDIVGDIGAFGATLQIAPVSLTLIGDTASFSFPSSLMDPVTLTTADINPNAGEGVALPNWDELSNLRGQYVRIEGARMVDREVSDTRPDWNFTSDDGMSFVNKYDTSLRYRNDRSGTRYDSLGFNVLTEDFVPPPIGATINIQGFLTFNSFDPFGRSAAADDVIWNINPFEDADLEVTAAPPTILSLNRPASNPIAPGFDVRTVVTPGADRTLARVDILTESEDGTMATFTTTADADTFTTTVALTGDEGFFEYWVEAEDDLGAVVNSDKEVIRVLDAVDSIEDIRRTIDDGPGDSPFKDIVTTMDVTAVVQTDPATGILVIQDNADLDAWSGIFVEPDGVEVAPGDSINITEATPQRRVLFGFNNETWLTNLTFTNISSGGDILGYKDVNTDLLQDESIAEAHQGMLLSFSNVVIVDNAPNTFGEWLFATRNMDGSDQASVTGDDASSLVAGGDELFMNGEVYEFMRGAWVQAFNSYRLLPVDPATDIGMLTDVSTEDLSVPGSFGLAQNYPNPFNPVTTINYAVPVTGQVTLEVFDLLGRSVRLLVDGIQGAGEHTVQFNAGTLPSGMYLYRLSAGEKVSTKKMLLLK